MACGGCGVLAPEERAAAMLPQLNAPAAPGAGNGAPHLQWGDWKGSQAQGLCAPSLVRAQHGATQMSAPAPEMPLRRQTGAAGRRRGEGLQLPPEPHVGAGVPL